jgi:mannose-6-phosphate isomerase-like protein (cupin superfamily)
MCPQPRSSAPPRHHEIRPWGEFEQFVHNEVCSVKILTVQGGQQLSLQSHRQRTEWWIVLEGSMDVEVDEVRTTLGPSEEIFIPLGARHRVFGGEASCRWLEIAFGVFDENDIVRYADSYGRQIEPGNIG